MEQGSIEGDGDGDDDDRVVLAVVYKVEIPFYLNLSISYAFTKETDISHARIPPHYIGNPVHTCMSAFPVINVLLITIFLFVIQKKKKGKKTMSK